MAIRVVHYINQFYAGKGGEDKADYRPESIDKPVGPGMEIARLLKNEGGEAELVGMVICGDSYYGEHMEEAQAKCLEMIAALKPDVVIAGPAFNAGRYGVACGDIAAAVMTKLNIPAVAGMYKENPGLELYGKNCYVVPTEDSARSMRPNLASMAKLALKLARKEPMGPAREEGYFSRGIRKCFFKEKPGAERAVEMMLARLRGEEFRTEYEMPVFNKIPPAAPLKSLKDATIAIISSGGVVPVGNPDHIRVSSADSYGAYDISKLDDMTPENYESIHGGYDRAMANVDPDCVVPLDELRKMEKEGVFKKLHEFFYTTTGTGTSVKNSEQFGQEIGKKLREANVDAAILTSTWGTCTRCGASMTREIEKTADIPVVQIATIVPIMLTVGSNRIVPGIAIPHPVGDPANGPEADHAVRRKLLERAFKAMTTEIHEQTVFEQ